MSDFESVKVALRVRPLVSSEQERGCQVAVEKVGDGNQVLVNNTESFSFNYVFDWRDSQEQLYQSAVSNMLDKLFLGFNTTILAYGQTGSGKTHTMGTAFNGSLDENIGVIPRAMHDIFRRIKQLSNEFDVAVKCSFVELYQEQLYDLLGEKSKTNSVISMREDRNGIIMTGLTEKVVCSAKETTDCLVKGSAGRAVASTAMNHESSRSHAIFTVTLESTKKDGTGAVTTSKFRLVDLAGSERSKKTGATGQRFKEGVKINQGLLALGNVISALGDDKGAVFIRYRDSKLTRLLQDSLGGSSVTLMIACVSPADYNVTESLSTLRYADRVRKIKNKPIVNQDPRTAEIKHLKNLILKLSLELAAKDGTIPTSLSNELAGIGVSVPPTATTKLQMPVAEENLKCRQLEENYNNLQQKWQKAAEIHENLTQKVLGMKSELNKINGALKVEDCELRDALVNIKILVEDIDNEMCRAEAEIKNFNQQQGAAREPVQHVLHSIIEGHNELVTSQQMEINKQLRNINEELNQKGQLQQHIADSFIKLSTLDDDITEKLKACTQKIHELETEKSELLDKLYHVKENVTAKLSEERRKRLHTLQQEVSALKQKNSQQAKLHKMHEKEAQQIKNLTGEILALKASKVKLMRALRYEADNFRKCKMLHERELMLLKNKERKMQNDIALRDAYDIKRHNVLKRKCAEVMAANKRFKETFERQSKAQTQWQKVQTAKEATDALMKIDQIIISLEREVKQPIAATKSTKS